MPIKDPVRLIWTDFLEGRRLPVVIDHRNQVHEAATRFLIYKAQEHLKSHAPTDDNLTAYKSTVHDAAYAVREYLEFLRLVVPWEAARDIHLGQFKEDRQKAIAEKAASRTSQTAKGTANHKLTVIYELYWWAQEEANLISDCIGAHPRFPIRSTICEHRAGFSAGRDAKRRTLYPLLERGIASRNRHRHQHYAEPFEIGKAKRGFREKQDFLVAERNVILVDLLDVSGWRRGSLASLKIGQFDDAAIRAAVSAGCKTWRVTPDAQKFGHRFAKEIPIQTAVRLANYVQKVRARVLFEMERGEEHALGALFISHTTCKPLAGKSITQILSSAFSEQGIQKGAGAHSLRRGYGQRRSQEIMAERKRKGMSLDPKDITTDLADDLGQSSTAAQSAYTAGKKSMYADTPEASLRAQLEEQRLEADNLRRRVAELEGSVATAQ